MKAIITFIKEYKLQLLIVAVSLLCYLMLAYAGRHYYTFDTVMFLTPWWNYISREGWQGIATMNGPGLGDYTTIWYFIVAIFTKLQLYPNLPIEYCIKFIAMTCSLLSAVAVFFITRHFHPKSKFLPVIAACITPFLPTFSIDLLKSNFTDGMYIMPSLWSFYFFLKGKKEVSWFLLAFGACFKLMAVYLVPVYLYFYIKDFARYSLREKLAPLWGIVAVFVCSIPNFLAGGKLLDGIITPILDRNEVGFVMPYFWLIPSTNNFMPATTAQDMRLMLYALLIFIFFFTFFFTLRYVREEYKTQVGLTVLPAISILVCFYLMPSQHETYFTMAAIFAFIGFLALLKKEFFVNFIVLNIFLFCMYLFGLSWWHEGQIRILPDAHMGFIYLGIVIFNYYILYQHSVFYRSPEAAKTIATPKKTRSTTR